MTHCGLINTAKRTVSTTLHIITKLNSKHVILVTMTVIQLKIQIWYTNDNVIQNICSVYSVVQDGNYNNHVE